MARGRLIVFEGVEGAGKSTQLDLLGAHLSRAGVAIRTLREPGSTPLGDDIRRLLLNPASHIAPRAEALLFMASRAELVARELVPALDAQQVVLLDRYFLSTYAYQVAGRGLALADVEAANRLATAGLVPDVTLLLTFDAREGLARATSRSARDRMELADDEFHQRVERAFAEFATSDWQGAHPECGPVVAINASGSERDVGERVLRAVGAHCAELRVALGAAA